MNDKEILAKSSLTYSFTILKSKYRVMVLLPITALNTKLLALNVYKDDLKRTDFKIIESDNKLLFINLLTGQENVFDLTELNIGKIHFRFQNGVCETFEVKDLMPLDDLRQCLG